MSALGLLCLQSEYYERTYTIDQLDSTIIKTVEKVSHHLSHIYLDVSLFIIAYIRDITIINKYIKISQTDHFKLYY